MLSTIEARDKDLGGFSVGRVLPFARRKTVGPFIFFDHIGPADFKPGDGIDVRPHPHICLATVTYLFEGSLRHRDSLGHDQIIRPGDVNWMTAGQGIVHSERTDAQARQRGHHMHGIQSWVALPQAEEEIEPAFHHHAKDSLPEFEEGGARFRLIAGEAYGHTSPVKTFGAMHYLDCDAEEGARFSLPTGQAERAVYVASGQVEIGGTPLPARHMAVFDGVDDVSVYATAASRVMLLGGDSLDGPRHIWWNFVASSRERIERAKYDWKSGHFPKVPGDDEFIPLPEN